jgi:hypothetical protein
LSKNVSRGQVVESHSLRSEGRRFVKQAIKKHFFTRRRREGNQTMKARESGNGGSHEESEREIAAVTTAAKLK